MNRLRPAVQDDFSTIYNLQNIPHREKVFIEPLPAVEDFLRMSRENYEAGEQYYYMFERDGIPTGWIEHQKAPQTASMWGKWLSTLVYGALVMAFDDLEFTQLNWYTRATNLPMIHTCEKMKFRRTGQKEICNITQEFSFIAIGKIFFYAVTAEEFQSNRHWMKELALPIEFQFRNR